MEMEELKNAWTALDNRLKENKPINETIILEMINTANRSAKKLINQELRQIFGWLIMVLFVLFLNLFHYCNIDPTLLVILEISVIFQLCWTGYKLYGLKKIDFSKKLHHNIYYANKYKLQIDQRKMTARDWLSAILLFVLLMIIFYKQNSISPDRIDHENLDYKWLLISIMVIVITNVPLIFLLVIAFKQQKKRKNNTKKYIHSLLQSLNELKELEKEEKSGD